jgi:hypothetical protein
VVDAGGVRVGAGGLRHGTVHVAADDEWDRGAGGLAVQEHVDPGQVFGVVAQLDPPADEGRVDGVGVAFQRTVAVRITRRVTDHPKRLPDQGRVRLAVRAPCLEPVDGALAGLGVHPPVGDLLGPGGE